MTDSSQNLKVLNANLDNQEFEGVYGSYRITEADKIEVRCYRISLLVCGIAFTAGMSHWLLIGPELAWLWLIPITIGLGLALKWIHIYISLLHKSLQIFWGLGCIGLATLILNLGSENVLPKLASNPSLILVIGPLFAALTGLGFKEFFCFRRIEAIGLTILIPIALLGHLSGILNGAIVMALLSISSALLLILSIRKFGMDASSDIGDKSVFTYLSNQQSMQNL